MSAHSRNNGGENMDRWTFADIPDQTGHTAIVTGANTGIGLETARMLALKGASVVLACRNLEKGKAAVESVQSARPRGSATLAALDLSDLDSVAAFAATFAASHERLDLLVANAGVMVPPFGRTKQGFELQLGTNHLGHFALVGRLLPLLLRTAGARIVVVSSAAQNFGRIDRDDLNWERRPYRGGRPTARASWRTSSSRSSCTGDCRRPGRGCASRPPTLALRPPTCSARRPARACSTRSSV